MHKKSNSQDTFKLVIQLNLYIILYTVVNNFISVITKYHYASKNVDILS